MVTPEESIPQYSDGYRHAQSVFYTQFNEVDFYVEDEEQENFYFCILRKLFPRVRFENIHPLRGKQNAIEHAKTNQSPSRAVYLLDKDFDDLLGRVHVQPNVFYLSKYCVENFLLEEDALVNFVVAEKPRLKVEKIRSELRFEEMWNDVVKQLSKLFAFFFIVLKHNISLPSTSQKPDSFCAKGNNCCLADDKVSGFAKSIVKRAGQQSISINLADELRVCCDAFELDELTRFQGTNVSGQFILHLFAHRIEKAFDLDRVPNEASFAYRLAQACTFTSLNSFRSRVNSYLRHLRRKK